MTAAVSILGLAAAAADPADASVLRFIAIGLAIALVALLIVKAIRDYRWGQSLASARYKAVRELHNTLGPALDMMTELATLARTETVARKAQLEKIADLCCSALVAMAPPGTEARAVVFALTSDPDRLQAIGRFGRNDIPRVFLLSDPAGKEIMRYLTADPQLGAQLFRDIQKKAPDGYLGRSDKYRTFIRAPIWSSGVAFGMLVIDAPKPKTLVEGDKILAELVAAELATAFAIAAPGGSA